MSGRVRVMLGGVGLVLVVLGAAWVRYRFTHSITRDAFVDSHLINVAPQVSGDVVEEYVQEQDRVAKGQLLALIDPSLYRREAELARAKLQVAEAALGETEANLTVLVEEVPQRIAAATARVQNMRATFTLAEEDYKRYKHLYEDRSVSERRFQEATQVHASAEADLAAAAAALELARLGNLQIEAARKLVAVRTSAVEEGRSAVALADTNLGYTRVLAPYPGVIAKKWRHLGDYARAGEPIVNMYNPELLYVTANLEETLLQGVAPGNLSRLQVRAFRHPFRGRVLWIGSATDANFSLIPRDVSSGEFTYIVQRVPIRIAIEPDDRLPQLKPGLSVQVFISHGPGDAAWAAEVLRRQAEISGVREEKP